MRSGARLAIWLSIALWAPVAAHAASVRGIAVVNGNRVHLSDLFRDLAPGQDVEIGDAPALGKNYIVSGPQLTAIAAQFAVDWPDASPLASVNVVRGTRMIDEDAVMPALREALHLPVTAANVDIVLNGFHPVAVPAEAKGGIRILQVVYAPQRGDHFSARLSLGGALDPINVPLNGTASVTQAALVLRHAVRAGDPVEPDDFESVTMRAAAIPVDAIQNASEVEGLIARTSLAAGATVEATQLAHPALITRGDPVVISYAGQGLQITASGVAMQPGGRADIVRVFNPATNMVITGRITDKAQVEILPGAIPVPAGRHGGQTNARNLPLL